MNLISRMKEIDARLAEIRTVVTTETQVEKLKEYETECDKLQEERMQIQAKLNIMSKSEVKPLTIEVKANNTEELEVRGKALKEARAVTVSSEEILLPTHTNTTIAGVPFAEYSEIVDKVHTVNLNGGETYTKSYVKSSGEAELVEEGKPATESDPSFGYVTISKVKVTAYAEITEEIEKLPAINYQAEVLKSVNKALKKKISKQIINGAGTANSFTGIFSDKADALKDSEALEIKEIDNTTLRKIVFGYGGDEAVEGGCVLVLSKADLSAFANLTKKNGDYLHRINTQAKTIDDIPYIINSNCASLSNPSTKDGTYCIAYGPLQNYEVPIFSSVEVTKSNDYKFKDGIICYKATVFTGGNVVGYKGFLRVKKAVDKAISNQGTPDKNEE